MNHRGKLKRPLLYALIGSVVLGAVAGIIVVLRNRWDWFEIRVILTTIIVAVASLCGLACDLSRTPRGANLLPRAGLALIFLGAVLLLWGMWSDVGADWYWKSSATVSILAVATVHVCLLSIARLTGRFAWVYFIACQVIYGLALLLCAMILWEIDHDGLFRFVVTLAIVATALSLVIPLLHRISRAEAPTESTLTPLNKRNLVAIDAEIALLRKKIAELELLRAGIVDDGSAAR